MYLASLLHTVDPTITVRGSDIKMVYDSSKLIRRSLDPVDPNVYGENVANV